MMMYRTTFIASIWGFLLISCITSAESTDSVSSEWPSGPYAVPMTIDGCPEDSERGWLTSFIKITTKQPIDRLESYLGCLASDTTSQAFENHTNQGLKHISWLYDAYSLQMNFCFKLSENRSVSNASWPMGNYSIYGARDGCPDEFDAHTVTTCLPQPLAVDQGGYLPFVTLQNTKSNETARLEFTVCTRKTEDVTTDGNWTETHPFSLLGVQNQDCPSIANHQTSEEMLPLFVHAIDENEYTAQQMTFCHFMPNGYRYGARTSYGMAQQDMVKYLLKDCRALLYVTASLHDNPYEGQISGFPPGFHGKAVQFTMDTGKVVRTSGVMLKFDNFNYFDLFLQMFANKTRFFTNMNGARVCRHNETAWKNSESDFNVIFTCIRVLEARYFTLAVEVTDDTELLKEIMADVFITLLSCEPDSAERNTPACHSDQGMGDLGVQDFQLSASSSQISHEPKQARPQFNGWCAAIYDEQPYLQINLVAVTTIEGVVIYNWMELDTNRVDNIYNVDAYIRGCRSFRVEYGIGIDRFMRLTEEPFVIDPSRTVEEPSTILFNESFPARYLRVYPYSHDKRKPACLKLEVLGCRKAGTLSLNCHQSQQRELFETDSILIPTSGKSETQHNLTKDDCLKWCLYNKSECIGTELSNNSCNIFESDEMQNYILFHSNGTLTTAPCLQDGTIQGPIYFDIFEENLSNVQTTQFQVNNPTILTSEGYPFSYDKNRVHRWKVYSVTGKSVTLQFTDISLNTNIQFDHSRMFINDDLCKDTIIVSTEEAPRIASRLGAVKMSRRKVYIFDNKYNGKYPKIPSPYSNIFLEFRTCVQRQYEYKSDRGFSVYIYEEDGWHSCLQNSVCTKTPMELSSGTFLGHLPEVDMDYSWTIFQFRDPLALFELLDFDVSCSSGSTFSIHETHTKTEITYCNANRPFGVFPSIGNNVIVRYSTSMKSCGQFLFQEGFRLSYVIQEREDKLLNLTTSQTEMVDNLPVMVITHTSPLSKRDVSRYMLNGGRIRKVCSGTFKKCYTIYIGMPTMTWIDSSNMCKDRNQTLVSFRSKLEMRYVRIRVVAWLVDIGNSALLRKFFDRPLHIGLIRYAKNSHKYRNYWSDGSLLEFTAWDVDEPKDVFHRHCTSMSLTENRGWKTESCEDFYTINIVCESALDMNEKTTHETDSPLFVITRPEANAMNTMEHLLFKCDNGEWVSRLARCNGVGECIDRSDENGCLAEGECEEDEFKCDGSRCIHISNVCDHVYDCNDLSDELCEYGTCSVYRFECDNGICVNLHDRCNTIINCIDESDERDCDFCKVGFKCELPRTCIREDYVCDGYVDCDDASDESNCTSTTNTCDELLNGGITESGLKILDDKYIRCEFEMDDNGNPLNHTMTYLSIDWMHLKKAEYELETHEFIENALKSGYICSQMFTQEPRQQVSDVNELRNEPFEAKHVVLKYISLEEESYASSDTFAVNAYPTSTHLRYFDNFDIGNHRITIGPVMCSKDSDPDYRRPIACGNGLRPIDKSRRCLYSIDSEFHVDGCVSLNHLQDCAEFVCPDGYVKCPGSYCIYSHHVCDGNMDCVYGEDEANCWCKNDAKTILIFTDDMQSSENQEKAYNLAGKMNSRNQTVMVLKYRTSYNYMLGQLIRYSSGHQVYNRYEYPVYFPHASGNWEDWSLEHLLGLHQILTASYFNMLIWVSDSQIHRTQEFHLNYIQKYIGIYNGETKFYHVRTDLSLKSKTKVVPSPTVTEVFLLDWAILDAVGPLLFTEDCLSLENTSCSQGYRCLLSRVCIPLEKVCDNIKQCPKGDDELNCEFTCPPGCICGLLTMKCFEEDENRTLLLSDIHSSTRSLDLSNTKTIGKAFLTSYDRDMDFRSLLSLNISMCEITTLTYTYFLRIKNLEKLDISYNRLTRVPSDIFPQLARLTHLYLHGNSLLTYIEPGAFKGSSIRSLDFTGCSLSSLSMNTFEGLSMNELDISYNKIEEVEDLAFNGLSVEHLKTQGNMISLFTKNMFNGLSDVKTINTPAYKFCCIRPSYLKEESCLPYKDEFSSCADLMRNQSLRGLLWTIGSLALLGNILSLIYRIIFDKKRLKIGYGIFVTNLAISDLLMGIYLFIIAVADRIFRDRYIEVEDYWRNSSWCLLAGVLSTLSSEASVLFIALITIDRILVIKFPFGDVRISVRVAVMVSIACWVAGLFLSILPLVYVEYFRYGFYGKSAVCLALPLTRDRPPGWLYSISIFVGFNFAMFVLIAIGQLLIYLEIRKQTITKRRMNVTRRNDLKVARNLLLLVTTDFMCWFPIGCMGIMAITGHAIPGEVYSWTAVLVLPINSALNPFLYTFSAIINSKSFNPNLEEQQHTNLAEVIGRTFVRLFSFFNFRGRKAGKTNSLPVVMAQRSLRKQEILQIATKITKGISYFHDNCLVLKTLDKENIVLQMSNNGKVIRNAYLDQQPYMSSGKMDKAEDIFALGRLIGECIESLESRK